jgi:hypothetical protein
MHFRRFALVAFAALSFVPAVGNGQEPATIAAANYRLDFTIMGQTMGEDVVVEIQDKKITIRKPMQMDEHAFQGTIDGDKLTAEAKPPDVRLKLTGKITKDAAEGTLQVTTPAGMKIDGTFKLKKR